MRHRHRLQARFGSKPLCHLQAGFRKVFGKLNEIVAQNSTAGTSCVRGVHQEVAGHHLVAIVNTVFSHVLVDSQ